MRASLLLRSGLAARRVAACLASVSADGARLEWRGAMAVGAHASY